MQMMRESYLRRDSLYRAESDSLSRLDSVEGAGYQDSGGSKKDTTQTVSKSIEEKKK